MISRGWVVRRVLITSLFFVVSGVLFGQSSLNIDVKGQAMIPLRGTESFINFGGGAVSTLLFEGDGLFYGRGGLGYTFLDSKSDTALNLITARIGGGVQAGFGSLIDLRLGLYGGGYLGVYSDLLAYNPSVGAELDLSFNLSPGFSVDVGTSYDYHVGSISFEGGFSEDALVEGISIGLSARFRPGAAGSSSTRQPRIHIEQPTFDRVFPVFYRYYNDTPLGAVTIRNEERRRITNVKVSFFVNQYMDAPKVSATYDSLDPGEEIEVPLLALFRDSVLGITEGTSVTSEVIVEYQVDGDQLRATRTETLPIMKRNNMTWDDDRKAAAFVTANDPTVSRFARNINAAVRSEGAIAVNERLRIAMAIFQALHLYGMEYVIDPDSSYIELSHNESAIDYLQFPQQTLDFRSGDCDDLSILCAALLESVGIRTAFLTIPGHLYLAFALDMDEKEARQTFSDPGDFIFQDDEAWVPLEVTMVRDDFLQAWETGAKQWRENVQTGSAAMYPVRAAWQTYAPTAFSSDVLDIPIPQTTEVVPNYTALLRQFVDREIAPQVTELERRIEQTNGNPRLVNRLGTLYARYGLYEDAEREFLRAAETDDYRPALLNLGNIAYLRDDLDQALTYYRRAFRTRQDDPQVLISLARVHFDREEYPPATERYRQAEVLDPELAEEFAYIVSENREAGRASAAQDRNRVIWGEE